MPSTIAGSRWPAVVAVAVLAATAAPRAGGLEPPAEYALTAGAAHLLQDERTGLAGIEARWAAFGLRLGRELPVVPALGLTVDGEGATYAYLGFRIDAAAALGFLSGEPPPAAADRRWRLVSFTGLGYYGGGDDGPDLGGPLQFRSGVELARRIGRRSHFGLTFDHLSNAGIYSSNRGSESLVLTWSWSPLKR